MNPKLSILSQPSSFRQLLCALFLLLIEDASQIVFFRSSFPYFSLVPPLIWNWKKSSCCLYAPKRGTCFGNYLSFLFKISHKNHFNSCRLNKYVYIHTIRSTHENWPHFLVCNGWLLPLHSGHVYEKSVTSSYIWQEKSLNTWVGGSSLMFVFFVENYWRWPTNALPRWGVWQTYIQKGSINSDFQVIK